MRPSTVIHWRFENSGNRKDTLDGSGNFVELATNLAKWMQGVTMNNHINIRVTRQPAAPTGDAIDSLADTLMADLGLSEANFQENQ